VLRDGVKVGTVARVDHFPAQDMLIVTTASGEVMVPFVKAIVSGVDLDAKTVTVTPPLGLFEEIADDDVEADGANSVDSIDAGDGGGSAGD
jgi:16S rRNA processing protein RimM